jgi:hypothetical protein
VKPVERAEVLDIARYEEIREPFRRRIIELKRARRVALGSNMTVLFENRDTVLYQIQEMIRTERITREDAILHELETYNELIPKEDELSATIFIEYPEREERERMLSALVGLEDKFALIVGASKIPARNETRGALPDRTTAVQYAKIPLGVEVAQIFRSGAGRGAALSVEHEAYRARAELTPRTLEELAQDLVTGS